MTNKDVGYITEYVFQQLPKRRKCLNLQKNKPIQKLFAFINDIANIRITTPLLNISCHLHALKSIKE